MKQCPEVPGSAYQLVECEEGRGLVGWNWSWVELAGLPDKFLVLVHPAWWFSV